MTDRFDLETQITNASLIVEELKLLNEGVLERDLSKDDISNILIGLATLYELKFDKLINSFEQLVNAKKII